MNEAVIAVDDAQRIVLFNAAAEAMFGYTVGEVLLPEAARAEHRRQASDFAAASERYRTMAGRFEIGGRRKDGTGVPAQGAPSKAAVAGRTDMVVVAYDLSNLRALRESLDVFDARHRALFIRFEALETHVVPALLHERDGGERHLRAVGAGEAMLVLPPQKIAAVLVNPARDGGSVDERDRREIWNNLARTSCPPSRS